MMKQTVVLPPSWLGILGGGQLGMMLAIVAKQFGYNVAILEPDPDCPAKRVADLVITGSYTNAAALKQLADLCAVVTTEFENVPADSVRKIAETTQVYPAANALLIAQNRIKEKTFFRSIGLSTAEFAVIKSVDDCINVDINLLPAILKTTTLGYDGKGQVTVFDKNELIAAYNSLGGECILEHRVSLLQEVSIIVARNQTGSKVFPLIENQHRNGILDISYIPANTSVEIHAAAHSAAIAIVNGLDYTGLLTIEFFITTSGELLVNEIAPRPHNSGHITIETAVTSQFEQQLRAVCGLELGDTNLKQSGAMLNLLGDVWLNKEIKPEDTMLNKFPDAKYHSYGKTVAKLGRKMGHISLCNLDREILETTIAEIKHQLEI